MASNAELIAQAKDLAEALDMEISTDGLNNAALAALVSDLKAKKKDTESNAAEEAEAKAAAEEAEAKAAAEEAEAKAAAEYTVATGKAVTSKRGILSDGDEIKADDLAGGSEALSAFVKSGHVVKN